MSDLTLLTCFVFALQITTVGYGDISPQTDYEKVIAVLGMFIGGFSFAMLLGNISTAIATLSYTTSLHAEKMLVLKEYMEKRQVYQHTDSTVVHRRCWSC